MNEGDVTSGLGGFLVTVSLDDLFNGKDVFLANGVKIFNAEHDLEYTCLRFPAVISEGLLEVSLDVNDAMRGSQDPALIDRRPAAKIKGPLRVLRRNPQQRLSRPVRETRRISPNDLRARPR